MGLGSGALGMATKKGRGAALGVWPVRGGVVLK
jgi:hypothetical protein